MALLASHGPMPDIITPFILLVGGVSAVLVLLCLGRGRGRWLLYGLAGINLILGLLGAAGSGDTLCVVQAGASFVLLIALSTVPTFASRPPAPPRT